MHNNRNNLLICLLHMYICKPFSIKNKTELLKHIQMPVITSNNAKIFWMTFLKTYILYGDHVLTHIRSWNCIKLCEKEVVTVFLCWHLLLRVTHLSKKPTDPQRLISSSCLCSSITDLFWMFFKVDIILGSVCSINRLHAKFKMKNLYKHSQGIVVDLHIDKN